MTRPGIALYGVHPLRRSGHSPLQPAFEWQARILQIRNAAAGDKVGYGGTYQLDRDSQIATLGVGYADGYRRQLGGIKPAFQLAGRPAPVIGRVSMDSITVDVTGLNAGKPVHRYSIAYSRGLPCIEKMARDAGTIPYEIMSGLGYRAKRHYLGCV